MARVVAVMTRSMEPAVKSSVTGSMSAKKGVARAWRTAFAAAMKVNEGRMTSSPSPHAKRKQTQVQAGCA